MDDIRKRIVDNFNKNINYFEKNHKSVFQKLTAYDNAVANGHYNEKYELVFEGDNFDVLEKQSGKYLYDKKLTKHTELSKESVDFDLHNNAYECFFAEKFTKEQVDEFCRLKTDKPMEHFKSYVAPIVFHIQKDIYSAKQLKQIDKFIFFGVGLGLHVEAIDEKISAKSYLIVEDDLELFRLSLFTIDYEKLAKKAKLFFSVFEDETEFAQSTQDFLEYKYFLNHYIKYFQLLSHSEDKADRFYVNLLSQPHLQFLFNDYLKNTTHPMSKISQKYKILQSTIDISNSMLKDAPFLLIASGPSLQKQIGWLKENHKKFIIVAVSSALKFLELNNIKADIVLHLDPFSRSFKSFEVLDSLSFVDDSLIVCALSSPDILFEKLKKQNIWTFEVATNYNASSLKLSSPCVGSLGFLFLLAIKAKEIYLLGLDLAVDQQSGKNHIDTHQGARQLKLENQIKDDILNYKNSLFEVDGNLKNKVLTTPHFFASADIINRYFSKIKKPFQNIYNMSDGVYFLNTKPIKPDDVHVDSLCDKTFVRHIFECFYIDRLKDGDIIRLKSKLKHAQKLVKKLNGYKPNKNIYKYAQDLKDILAKDEDLYGYEVSRSIDSYLHYVLHFVYFYLNIVPNDLDNIHKILVEQIAEILKYYIYRLEKMLQEV